MLKNERLNEYSGFTVCERQGYDDCDKPKPDSETAAVAGVKKL